MTNFELFIIAALAVIVYANVHLWIANKKEHHSDKRIL